MIGDDVLIGSGALVGLGILARGGINVFRWQREISRQADAQERLMHGDPTDPEGWPGIKAAYRLQAAATNKVAGQVSRLDAGQVEVLGRLSRLERKVTINGLNSDGVGDAVGRIEERLSGDSRQQTLDQRKPKE